VLCNSCKINENKTTNVNKQSILKSPLDSTYYLLDTTIKAVKLNEELYNLFIYRDRFNKSKNEFNKDKYPFLIESPVTIAITNSNDSLVFKETYRAENEITKCIEYVIYPVNSMNHISKNIFIKFKYNDGYGTPNDWFNTFMISKINGNLVSKKIFTSWQFSLSALNMNEKEIILLNGIWNNKENEDRASAHRYTIVKYSLNDDIISKKEIGKTSYKYASSFDNKGADDILGEIKLREPKLLMHININEYKDLNHSLN
jgi:hypothetical protein